MNLYSCGTLHLSPMQPMAGDWSWHSELELVRVDAGNALICVGTERLALNAGGWALLSGGALHACKPESGEADVTVIHLHPTLAASEASDAYARLIAPVMSCRAMNVAAASTGKWQNPAIACLVEQIFALNPSEPAFELTLKGLTCLLLAQMYTAYSALAGDNVSTNSLNLADERVKRMLTFMQANYQRDLTIDAIAAAASVSRTECFRCFRRAMGVKPVEYLTALRIGRAADMLFSTRMSVSAISAACGFVSPSYFGKVFYSAMGCSPRAYRTGLAFAGEVMSST